MILKIRSISSVLFYIALLIGCRPASAQDHRFQSTTPEIHLDFPFQMMWDDAVTRSAKTHRPALVFDLDLVDTNSLTVAHRVIGSREFQKFISTHFEPALNDFAVDPPMAVGLDSLRNLGWRLSGFEKNYIVPNRPTLLVIGLDTNEIDRIIEPQKFSVKHLEARLLEILANRNTLRSAIADFYLDTTNVEKREKLIDLFEEHSRYDSVLRHLEVLMQMKNNPDVMRNSTVRYSFLRMQAEGNIAPLEVLMSSLDRRSPKDSELYLNGLEALLDYYKNRKKVDSAASYYDQIMSFSGVRDAWMLNDYAWMLANQSKQNLKASALIEEALLQKPNDPNLLDTKALIEYNLGQKNNAVAAARRALSIAKKQDKKYFKDRLVFYQKALKEPALPAGNDTTNDKN